MIYDDDGLRTPRRSWKEIFYDLLWGRGAWKRTHEPLSERSQLGRLLHEKAVGYPAYDPPRRVSAAEFEKLGEDQP